MKQPYEITLKDGVLPSVIINAPAIAVRPHAWRTRLAWAWRCLQGRSFDLSPVVRIEGCRVEASKGQSGISIGGPLVEGLFADTYFITHREGEDHD